MMAFDKEHAVIILQRIFENGVCSDRITLIAGNDGQRIPIHRNVLIAASKYFAASLGPNFQEGKKNEFNLDKTDGETVKTIVDFCYTGHIDLSAENVKKFLTIASSVELDLLEEKCRRFYNDNLNANSAVEILIVADRYSYVDLRQRAFDVVCGSFDMVPTTDIQKLNHHGLQELLKSDKIQATEDLVFKRMFEWFQHNEEKRKQYMPELLKLIRLDCITVKFLQDTVESVFKNFQCSKLVFVEYKRRASSQCSNIDVRRARSIFCVFRQIKGENDAEYFGIKIEKFNNLLNSYQEVAEITLSNRTGFNAVLQKNKLFVFGGRIPAKIEDEEVHLKRMSSFDLNTREESILPEMSKPRSCCTTIFFGKYIYVFGGLFGMDSCERFDTEKNEWKEIKSMKVARYWASATVLNGYVYVAGGINGIIDSASVELYDPKFDEWTEIKPMNRARYAFALVEWDGFLYAMGGHETLEKYDPWKNCWTEIGSFEGSDLITSGINVAGQIFVVMRNGNFGEIKIDESGKCLFDPLGKSNYVSESQGRHFLYKN